MSDNTDFLFPVPSQPPSAQSPYHWPGVTPQSTSSLLEVLKDNHKRWHIFTNDIRFHNHNAHHALAVWALGADGAVVEAGYENDSKQPQRSLFKSPEPITDSNLEEHLGDERFYQAYVEFFTEYIRKHGMQTAFETFIFSKKYNLGEKKPEMLSRFLSGLLHPVIHVGYSAEFGLPGLLVEGLAQTAVHHSDMSELLPTPFFDSIYAITDKIIANTPDFVVSATQKAGQIAAHLDASIAQGNLAPLKASIKSSSDTGNVHALTILARVMADDRLDHPEDVTELDLLQNIKKHGELIQHYASQWTINVQKSGEIYDKAQELAWMNVTIYGIAGWTWAQKVKGGNEGEFNADFFFMHLVTSSVFLPSLLAYISHSPRSQVLLLRSYLAASLSWYVARGRPKLEIKDFFMSPTSTAYPFPINQLPTPHKDVLPGKDKPQARVPDPWLPIVQTTVVHQDDHLAKIIRALANYASKWGTTPAGALSGPGTTGTADEVQGEKPGSRPIIKQNETIVTELPEAEYLDGTLFIRVAGLTVARMGRVGQGEAPAEFWDMGGFYKSAVTRK